MAKEQTAEDSPEIKALRGQMAQTEAARREAEQRAAALEDRVETEQERRVAADLAAAKTAIAAANSDLDSAERDLAQSITAKDPVAQARATRAMNAAQSRLDQAEGRVQAIENWKTKEAARLKALSERGSEPTADLIGVVDLTKLAPKAAAWVREHPEAAASHASWNMVLKEHYGILADGIAEGTDEYFAALSERAGKKPDPTGRKEPAPGKQRQAVTRESDEFEVDLDMVDEQQDEEDLSDARRRQSPDRRDRPAGNGLPVSRTTPNISERRTDSGRIRLNAREVEAAKFSNPDLPEREAIALYAKNKARLQEEGIL